MDGDDAYYVAISTAVQSGKIIEVFLTGMNTELDVRQRTVGFLPIWQLHGWRRPLRCSGGQNIAAGCARFYDIWRILSVGSRIRVFRQVRLPFRICTEVLANVGDYFLLYRGQFYYFRKKQHSKRAALGSISIPSILPAALVFCRLQEEKIITVRFSWMLLGDKNRQITYRPVRELAETL